LLKRERARKAMEYKRIKEKIQNGKRTGESNVRLGEFINHSSKHLCCFRDSEC
jgi:hypothetical protein